MQVRSKRKRDLIGFGGVLAIVILINLLVSSLVIRWDLTSEKRYTLADITKEFLSNMDDPVFARVYLSGDFNVGLERLSQSVREKLDEFDVYAGSNLDYQFFDPSDKDEMTKRAMEMLDAFDLDPVPVYESKEDGSRKRSLVYPYLIFQHGEEQIVVNFLENMPGQAGKENLNASIEGLEYKFTDALRRLEVDAKQKIAFLEGHGELEELDVIDVTDALSKYYQVDRGNPGNNPQMLEPYDALIIARPVEPFSESEKYAIDQYIMNGGSVLWLIDAIKVSADSLRTGMQTVGLPLDVNLSDQLFRYGFRVNPELVQDIQCGVVPVNVAPPGASSRFVAMPWIYNPLLNTNQQHPVTRNVTLVEGEFTSSVDTVGDDININMVPLLRTGSHSRSMQTPVFVSLAQVDEQPRRGNFPQSHIPVAYAAEGEFPSVFLHRAVPPDINYPEEKRRLKSVPTRMIVVGDGDIIKNEVRQRNTGNPRIMPLGFDEAKNQTYGNKQFILNAVNYLTDDEGWMVLRTRNFRLRLLDRDKIANEADFWKMINVGIPLLLVLIAGIIVPLVRKKRFGKMQ